MRGMTENSDKAEREQADTIFNTPQDIEQRYGVRAIDQDPYPTPVYPFADVQKLLAQAYLEGQASVRSNWGHSRTIELHELEALLDAQVSVAIYDDGNIPKYADILGNMNGATGLHATAFSHLIITPRDHTAPAVVSPLIENFPPVPLSALEAALNAKIDILGGGYTAGQWQGIHLAPGEELVIERTMVVKITGRHTETSEQPEKRDWKDASNYMYVDPGLLDTDDDLGDPTVDLDADTAPVITWHWDQLDTGAVTETAPSAFPGTDVHSPGLLAELTGDGRMLHVSSPTDPAAPTYSIFAPDNRWKRSADENLEAAREYRPYQVGDKVWVQPVPGGYLVSPREGYENPRSETPIYDAMVMQRPADGYVAPGGISAPGIGYIAQPRIGIDFARPIID